MKLPITSHQAEVARCLFILLIIFCFTITPGSAQNLDARHNTYLEAWGNTGLFSLNYDYLSPNNIGFRIGLMGEPKPVDFGSETFNSFGIVGTANLLLGQTQHKLELGTGGYAEVNQGTNEEGVFLTSTLGYRYQGDPGEWLFRVGFTPTYNSSEFFWRFGLSVGKVFHY